MKKERSNEMKQDVKERLLTTFVLLFAVMVFGSKLTEHAEIFMTIGSVGLLSTIIAGIWIVK
jgi:hypothetical protein